MAQHEFTKIEWWDVCRKLRPTLSWEEYEKLWEEFQIYKRTKKLN